MLCDLRGLLTGALLLLAVGAELSFEAHRLLQVDQRQTKLGSRKVGFGGKEVTSGSGHGDLGKYTPVIRFKGLTAEKIRSFQRRRAQSLLVILPSDSDIDSMTDEQLEEWREREMAFIGEEWDIAIYFAFDSPEMDTIFNAAEGDTADKFSLTGADRAKLVTKTQLSNYFGSIRGAGDFEELKSVLVVANYDSFAVVPTLASGANENASGVVAILELARIFKRLYDDEQTHGIKTVLFLLTAGGANKMENFAGTRHWNQERNNILSTVDFVLCLDSLARGDNLYLHVARDPESSKFGEITQNVYQTFTDTAAMMDIPFEILHHKVNPKRPGGWHHEVFHKDMNGKLLAATLSASPDARDLRTATSIFDRLERVSIDTLVRNIKFAGEAMSRNIYRHSAKGLEVVVGHNEVSRDFVSSWMEYLGSATRMAPYMKSESPLLKNMEKQLNAAADDTIKSLFVRDESLFRYYDAKPIKVSARRFKDFTWDLGFMLSTAVYLTLFAFILNPSFMTDIIRDASLAMSGEQNKKKRS